ncbi:CGNR zinc finger domain-containing protein [Kineosporia sp. J2-2]|uniref:CGNR zinc finger domain-containing protein n=1 Tax=Kineosporia corallincola TaxID=2835133 RepID=A0ABS5TG33_9ACTN|nr:CGNR zinc finger domain-containing protein [Kineosporia corallincola]MBT0770031.1 CGNR zinc finger domain-containing protein [Kineosporia corallincola]
MHFAPDTEEALDFVVALGNTDPAATRTGEDELATVGALAGLLARYAFSGRIDHDRAELDQVRETRSRLRDLWATNRDDAVALVNRMLRDAGALPQLVRHDASDWHLHGASPDAPLAQRLQVEAALAFVDVIRTDAMGRLRMCEANDCAGLLLDLSRNGSKRFCSVRCGNRMNMIAFRERRGAVDGGTTA